MNVIPGATASKTNRRVNWSRIEVNAIVGGASVESFTHALSGGEVLTGPGVVVANSGGGSPGRQQHQQDSGTEAQSALASD